jgi:hypothetical protein
MKYNDIYHFICQFQISLTEYHDNFMTLGHK